MPIKLQRFLRIPRKSRQKENSLNSNIASDSTFLYSNPNSVGSHEKPFFYRYVTFFLALILLLLLIFNYFLDKEITFLKSHQNSLVVQYTALENIEKNIKEIGLKVNYYKNIRDSRAFLGNKTALLLNGIDSKVSLKKLIIEKEEFTMVCSSQEPYNITKTLMNFLESEEVSEITLNTADYSSVDNMFVVEFTGRYK